MSFAATPAARRTSHDRRRSVEPWAKIVGPCYTVASMARALGWTEAEVVAAGESLHVLMLRTSDDAALFPSFQLIEGKVVEGLRSFAFSKREPLAGGRGHSG